MAPEQVLGHPVDGRTDQYALGIVAYQMLTGSVPFVAETPMAVALKQVHEPPPLPRSRNAAISQAVEQTLLVALAKHPGDRFTSCAEAIAALAAADSPISEPGAAMYPAPRRAAGPETVDAVEQTETQRQRARRPRSRRCRQRCVPPVAAAG